MVTLHLCYLTIPNGISMFKSITTEMFLISTGNLSVYEYLVRKNMEQPTKIPKDYMNLIQISEDIMRRILPGVHRLRTEGEYLETAQKYKFSVCLDYIKGRKVPCFMDLVRFTQIQLDSGSNSSSILTRFPTWDDWMRYLTIIVTWWDLCKFALEKSKDKLRNITLDATQHVLALLYTLETGYDHTATLPAGIQISYPIIPIDPYISIPDYIIRINCLGHYDIEKSYTEGLKVLKTCINELTTIVPIHELSPAKTFGY
jgi:hypothetical protein